MSEAPVTYRSQSGVALITINRPDRMNRLDDAIVEGLHGAWQRLMASEADRVAELSREVTGLSLRVAELERKLTQVAKKLKQQEAA